MRIYRALDWGGLARFQMIDARQYGQWTEWPAKEGEPPVDAGVMLRRKIGARRRVCIVGGGGSDLGEP